MTKLSVVFPTQKQYLAIIRMFADIRFALQPIVYDHLQNLPASTLQEVVWTESLQPQSFEIEAPFAIVGVHVPSAVVEEKRIDSFSLHVVVEHISGKFGISMDVLVPEDFTEKVNVKLKNCISRFIDTSGYLKEYED